MSAASVEAEAEGVAGSPGGAGRHPGGGLALPADADFVVLRDPDGDEFCVIGHAELQGPGE